MTSTQPSFSIGTVIQYAFLAGVAYILAGAPLLSVFNSYSDTAPQNTSVGSEVHADRLKDLVKPEPNLTCPDHSHKGTFVLSREPLVVYIEGFLSEAEATELVKTRFVIQSYVHSFTLGVARDHADDSKEEKFVPDLTPCQCSEPNFQPSTIWHAGKETLNPAIRNSEKAPLPRGQTVQCIEERARRFQGWRPYTYIEKLWSQKYGKGGHYNYHYDWSSATQHSGRISSFMVYLEANCTGGGTHFPRLTKPKGGEWCSFIECNDQVLQGANGDKATSLADGVVFKPIARNAVYWENIRADGTGYAESWHAGLPVQSGVKIGLNIWSWFQEGLDLS